MYSWEESVQQSMEQEKKARKKATATFWAIVIIIVFWFFCVMSTDSGSSSNSGDKGSTCAVCGRTFTDYENKKSIRRNNMCQNCYKNYEYGMAMNGKDVYGNDLNGK